MGKTARTNTTSTVGAKCSTGAGVHGSPHLSGNASHAALPRVHPRVHLGLHHHLVARVEADGRFRDSCELAARCLARDSEALAVGLHVQNILLAAGAGVEVALELDHDVEVRAAPRAAR